MDTKHKTYLTTIRFISESMINALKSKNKETVTNVRKIKTMEGDQNQKAYFNCD